MLNIVLLCQDWMKELFLSTRLQASAKRQHHLLHSMDPAMCNLEIHDDRLTESLNETTTYLSPEPLASGEPWSAKVDHPSSTEPSAIKHEACKLWIQ